MTSEIWLKLRSSVQRLVSTLKPRSLRNGHKNDKTLMLTLPLVEALSVSDSAALTPGGRTRTSVQAWAQLGR
jgi:hypothetical protein